MRPPSRACGSVVEPGFWGAPVFVGPAGQLAGRRLRRRSSLWRLKNRRRRSCPWAGR